MSKINSIVFIIENSSSFNCKHIQYSVENDNSQVNIWTSNHEEDTFFSMTLIILLSAFCSYITYDEVKKKCVLVVY